MRGTNGPRSRPCRPINVTCWRATGKLLKKNYHLGYAHREERGKGQGEGQGEGQGKGEGAASCAIVNSRENATKAQNADEVAAIKRCHTRRQCRVVLRLAGNQAKLAGKMCRSCVHACVCVCVCVIVNKLQRDRRHTQISMHCTAKRKRNHKQKKEKPKTKLEESKS